MIGQLFDRSATVLTGTQVPSGYGNATRLDWADPAGVEVMCWLGPYSGEAENAADRDQQIADATAYFPAGTVLTALNRVLIDADTYQVVGPPSRPWTPAGEHHVEADLKIVKG